MFEGMRTRFIGKAIGLLLALVLFAPPGFCWDCCCSATPEPEKTGHECCAEPDDSQTVTSVSAVAGCGCPEFAGSPYEAPRLLASISTPQFRESNAPSVAVLVDLVTVSHRPIAFGHRPTESPPRDSLVSLSSLSPRAPPTFS